MRSRAATFLFQQASALPFMAAGALFTCSLCAAAVPTTGVPPSRPKTAVTAATTAKNALAPKISPRGALTPEAALFAATAIAKRVDGGQVLSVLPTGGMRQTFDEKALVVVERTRLETVRTGDIISYEHPDFHQVVVQRVLNPSDLKIAPTTPVKRVVVVIYVRDNPGPGGLAATEAKPLSGSVAQATATTAIR